MASRQILLFVALVGAAFAENVLDLDDGSFESTVAEHDVILVEFFAPWCGHCKKLAPEYEKAATVLKSNDPPVHLAKVDCTEPGKAICGKYGVNGYPTLKIFKKNAAPEDYNGPREANGIVNYMRSRAGPACVEVKSSAALEEKFAKHSNAVVMVGYFDNADKFKEFVKAADKVRDAVFCMHTISKDIMKAKGHTDAVVLYRPKTMKNKFEESEVVYDGELNGADLLKFVNENSFGLCGHRTQDNAAKFGSEKPLVIVYYDVDYVKNVKGTNYWRNRVMKVAQDFKDDFIFSISHAQDFSYEKEEMGLKAPSKTDPQVAIRDTTNKKYPMTEGFSMDNLRAFLKSYQDGKLTPYLKSESIPENNDGPVKVAVAANFDDVITNVDKDVLVEFYAPWCGHCKKLAPILEELGEKLKDEDVDIVKMDATANDVPSSFDVTGFPTLFWLPRNDKNNPQRYEGGREVDDFIKHIAKKATNELKGFNRKGGEKKIEL